MELASERKKITFIYNHQPEIQNNDGNTVAMIYASMGIIPPKRWVHDPLLKNNMNQTVALLLSFNGVIPPQNLMHDINLKDNYGSSIKTNLQDNKLPVPTHWKDNELDIFDQVIYDKVLQNQNINPKKQNEDGWTVAMILALQNKQIPEQWYHNPLIQNRYGQTVFDICVKTNQIPIKEFCREIYYQDQYGNTQAMKLALKNMKIPKYLYHDPEIKNNDGYTVALIQAKNGKIPDKQWYHNKYIRVWYQKKNRNVKQYLTVENFLQNNNIKVPKEWQCNFVDRYDNTQAMLTAQDGQVPFQKDFHDPSITNKMGETVAMILASYDVEIPSQWYHNPSLQNSDGETVAMILADNGKQIDKQWYHNPTLCNENHYTVAHIQAKNKKIPDEHWQHSVYMRTKDEDSCYTVYDFLYAGYIDIPDWWFYSFKDDEQNTEEMLLAKQGIIPQLDQQCFQQQNSSQQGSPQHQQSHQDQFINNANCTPQHVTQYTPQQYTPTQHPPMHHHSTQHIKLNQYPQTNSKNETIAIILAKQGIIPPKQYYHNPNISDINGNTVASILASKGILPPLQWLIGIGYENKQNFTSKWQRSENYQQNRDFQHQKQKNKKKHVRSVSFMPQRDTIPISVDDMVTGVSNDKWSENQRSGVSGDISPFWQQNQIGVYNGIQGTNNAYNGNKVGNNNNVGAVMPQSHSMTIIPRMSSSSSICSPDIHNYYTKMPISAGLIYDMYNQPELLNQSEISLQSVTNDSFMSQSDYQREQHGVQQIQQGQQVVQPILQSEQQYMQHNNSSISNISIADYSMNNNNNSNVNIQYNNAAVTQNIKHLIQQIQQRICYMINFKSKQFKDILKNLRDYGYKWDNKMFILRYLTYTYEGICDLCHKQVNNNTFIKTKCECHLCLQCFKQICEINDVYLENNDINFMKWCGCYQNQNNQDERQNNWTLADVCYLCGIDYSYYSRCVDNLNFNNKQYSQYGNQQIEQQVNEAIDSGSFDYSDISSIKEYSDDEDIKQKIDKIKDIRKCPICEKEQWIYSFVPDAIFCNNSSINNTNIVNGIVRNNSSLICGSSNSSEDDSSNNLIDNVQFDTNNVTENNQNDKPKSGLQMMTCEIDDENDIDDDQQNIQNQQTSVKESKIGEQVEYDRKSGVIRVKDSITLNAFIDNDEDDIGSDVVCQQVGQHDKQSYVNNKDINSSNPNNSTKLNNPSKPNKRNTYNIAQQQQQHISRIKALIQELNDQNLLNSFSSSQSSSQSSSEESIDEIYKFNDKAVIQDIINNESGTYVKVLNRKTGEKKFTFLSPEDLEDEDSDDEDVGKMKIFDISQE